MRPAHHLFVNPWLAKLTPDQLLVEAQSLAADYLLLQGHGHPTIPGFFTFWSSMGPASVLLEVEVDGDDHGVVNVLINGKWCSVYEVATHEQVARWDREIDKHISDERAESEWQRRQEAA